MFINIHLHLSKTITVGVMLEVIKRLGVLLVLITVTSVASGQEVAPPSLKYVMTVTANLDQPYVIGDRFVFNVPSGVVKMADGSQGVIIEPGGEWATMYPNGVIKLDVRLTMKMEDQSLLLVTYSGKFLLNEAGLAKWQAGELITSEDCYFITAPLIRTQSESYGWLNSSVMVGKMVSVQPVNENGKPLYVTYDVYRVEP